MYIGGHFFFTEKGFHKFPYAVFGFLPKYMDVIWT